LKKIYICEKCDKCFDDEQECLNHEESCNPQVVMICHRCTKAGSWYKYDPNAYIKENQFHTIDLGKLGYGSRFDGCRISFDICDSCLEDFLDSFRLKEDAISDV